MSGDIANQLKGSRSDVESACKTIVAKFKEIASGVRGNADASYALRYELSVLRHICYAVKENLHQNADLYCDIMAIMLPHVEPSQEKPNLWEAHLTSLRYIHHGLCQEKSIAACQKLYNLIRSQSCRLQNDSDYKIYLDIHLTHFNGIHLQLQKQTLPLEATHHLCFSLEALGDLFAAMRQKKLTKNGPLLVQLNESMFGKRSRTFFKSLSYLPSESLTKMFDPLIKLLASNSSTYLSTQFAEFLSFALALFQIDMLNPQLSMHMALQSLRMCKEIFREDANVTYALQLVYYFLKIIYAREASQDFKRTYVDICRKFQTFFEQKGAAFAKEQWLTDLVIAIQRLQTLIHQSGSRSSSPFQRFWQQMEVEGGTEAYAAHFQLLHSCAAISVNVTRSSLGSNCSNESCKSQRRHCIMSFGMCALDAYINWQPTAEQKTDRSPHKPLLGIISYTMDVAKSLKCLGSTSVEVIRLVRQLIHVADKVSCAEQMALLLPLLEPLQQLRPIIADQELSILLRRLFKASCHCKDPQMASRLQACYIASLKNPVRLRSQISLHYHSQVKEGKEIQKCVYEWHESGPLPNPLTTAQKRQLYDTDLFAVLHNLRSPSLSHLRSLLRYRTNDYQLVLLARQMRNDGSVLKELQEMTARLRQKSSLTRMEQLSVGHANVGLLLDALEAQKTKISSKDVHENTMEEVLLRQNLSSINIEREHRVVKLASDSIAAFDRFFKRADEEPLGEEETSIDWEALVDDAVSAAMALSSMGYQQEAEDAWLLLLRIGSLLEDRFTYLRALTYFLSQNRVSPTLRLDLSKEVARAEDMLDDLWPQLQSGRFFKRQHTTVMLCLCHLASYYDRKDCQSTAQLLLLQVEQLREEFPERTGKSDIVLITLQTVRFRLSYHQRKPRNPRIPTPLRQLDTLLDNVRNFFTLSSLDAGSLQLVLAALVKESTECAANRLSERLAFSNFALQMFLQAGFALRSIEVFIAWLWTNLQMEYLDKAESKLRLVEHCLNIKPLARKQPPLESEKKEAPLASLESNMMLMQLVEPIRKQQQFDMGSPRALNMRPNSPSFHMNLERYVNFKQAPSLLRQNSQLQCVYFVLGCLHARLCFLQRNDDQLDEFYAEADSFLAKNPELRTFLGSMLQVHQVYKVNFMRYKKKHQESLSVCQKGLQSRPSSMDVNYSYNFMAQLKAAQLELKPLKPQCQKSRRALVFNLSPEQKLRPVLAAGATNSAVKVKQSAKKAPKFRIFTELELRPPSTSSSGSSGSGNENTPPSDRIDLNACQAIEISDDDDSPTTQPLKPSQSQAKVREKTKTKAKTKVSQVIELDDSFEKGLTQSKGTAVRSTRARIRQPEEETPKAAAVLSSRRPRRKVAEQQPAESECVSTRRRHRN
ncbi:protein three rows [Drosophila ananassae]|uniref:protein three rows n=1 Tax=Drosophila ananassae TaxID=7217 RepID=UPI0013A5CC84|nr:protein three rows [Drosophila ananassae]